MTTLAKKIILWVTLPFWKIIPEGAQFPQLSCLIVGNKVFIDYQLSRIQSYGVEEKGGSLNPPDLR